MIKLREIQLGTGTPKIVVPLAAPAGESLMQQARTAIGAGADLLEWRADYFDALETDALPNLLAELHQVAGNTPLIFTVRSASQGGKNTYSDEYAKDLAHAALATGEVDILDIELESAYSADLVTATLEAGVIPLVSHHETKNTPAFDYLYDIYQRELDLGARICKLAVSAQEEGDELRLMAATSQFANDFPQATLVGISMGELGTITRVAGEFFGSALTFCSAEEATAPGQLSVPLARKLIAQLHESGYNSTSTE